MLYLGRINHLLKHKEPINAEGKLKTQSIILNNQETHTLKNASSWETCILKNVRLVKCL